MRSAASQRRVFGFFIVASVCLIFAGLFAGGANSALSSSIAASVQLLLAGGILLMGGGAPDAQSRSPAIVLALFIAAILLGAVPLVARLPGLIAPDLGPPVLLKLAGYAAATITAFAMAATAWGRRLAFGVLTVGGLIFVLWTIGAALLQSPDTIAAPHHNAAGRLTGTLENANALACVAGVLALLGLGGAIANWPETGIYDLTSRKLLVLGGNLALVILSLAIIGLAGSRLTALLVVILALALIVPHRAHSQRHLARIVIAALALSMLVFGWRVFDRFESTGEDWDLRLSVYQRLAGEVATRPLTGHGLGSFREVNIRGLTDGAGWDWGAAHNLVLQSLIEGGLLFTIAIMATLGVILAVCLARRAQWQGDARIWSSFYAVLLVIAVAMIDIPLDFPAIASLWSLLLGLVWRASLPDTKPITHDKSGSRFA